jgi:hypothetical protein
MSLKLFSRVTGLVLVILSMSVAAVGAQSDEVQPDRTVPENPQWVRDRQQYETSFVYAPSQAVTEVEVAEDGNRFVFDDLNLFEDGMPSYGSAFVTQGYIYPVGTLNGSNGVLEDGTPEFPELVLGEWTCYGWMIGDGARTESGEWVISTQVYKFNDGSIVITDGFEIVDFDIPVTRAITGGTGQHRSASGVMVQILRGFTEQMGVNLSVEFQFDAS